MSWNNFTSSNKRFWLKSCSNSRTIRWCFSRTWINLLLEWCLSLHNQQDKEFHQQVDILPTLCQCLQVTLLTHPMCLQMQVIHNYLRMHNSNFKEAYLRYLLEECLSSTIFIGVMLQSLNNRVKNKSLPYLRLIIYLQPDANPRIHKRQRRMRGSQLRVATKRFSPRDYQSSLLSQHSSSNKCHNTPRTAAVWFHLKTNNPVQLLSKVRHNPLNLTQKLFKMQRKCRNLSLNNKSWERKQKRWEMKH